MNINPTGVALFLFGMVATILIGVFAGAPAVWWALGVWGAFVLFQVAVTKN